MKILHVIHSVDPRSGGPSTVIRNLVEHQARSGHEVAVLATAVQSAEPWLPTAEYTARMQQDPAFSGAELCVLRAFGRRRVPARFAFSPACAKWLHERFSHPQHRPNVVHIHGVFSHLTSAAAAECRAQRLPYILRPAGSLDRICFRMGCYGLKSLFTRLYLNKDLRHASYVQVTSPAEEEELKRWLPEARIRIIPHGASIPSDDNGTSRRQFLERFSQLHNRRIVLCLSRIHAIKRPELLVRAIAKLRAELPDVVLVFAGHDAGHQPVLERQIRHLGAEDAVVLTGFLEGTLKQGAFAGARLFALPSRHENLGVAVVEAMAHGVPVLVTAGVASHVYVDEARAGLTVTGDVEAITGGMRQLLDADRDAMGQRGRLYVQKHLTWPRIAERLQDLYESAAAKA